VKKEEFNRVDVLEEARDVWTTLRMAHEGSKPVRKTKIDMSCLMMKLLKICSIT
jgi:hypothetical protein